jgi:hypothetical protein
MGSHRRFAVSHDERAERATWTAQQWLDEAREAYANRRDREAAAAAAIAVAVHAIEVPPRTA